MSNPSRMKPCIYCGNYTDNLRDEKRVCLFCEGQSVVDMVKLDCIANYYGAPTFTKYANGSCAFELDDHSESRSMPISAEFFAACVKEFRKD